MKKVLLTTAIASLCTMMHGADQKNPAQQMREKQLAEQAREAQRVLEQGQREGKPVQLPPMGVTPTQMLAAQAHNGQFLPGFPPPPSALKFAWQK